MEPAANIPGNHSTGVHPNPNPLSNRISLSQHQSGHPGQLRIRPNLSCEIHSPHNGPVQGAVLYQQQAILPLEKAVKALLDGF